MISHDLFHGSQGRKKARRVHANWDRRSQEVYIIYRIQSAGEALLQLSSSIGSLERLFLLSRALLRMAAPRFDSKLQLHSKSAA